MCVECYCALTLEVGCIWLRTCWRVSFAPMRCRALRTHTQRNCNSINAELGSDADLYNLRIPDLLHSGYVDGCWFSFGWGVGGAIHAHIAFWIVGSPRIDKIDLAKRERQICFILTPMVSELVALYFGIHLVLLFFFNLFMFVFILLYLFAFVFHALFFVVFNVFHVFPYVFHVCICVFTCFIYLCIVCSCFYVLLCFRLF